MPSTGPTLRGSTSRKRTSNPRIPVSTHRDPAPGESGEEEATQSYREANTARGNISPPGHGPSMQETLRSSFPTHVSSSSLNLEDLTKETSPPENPAPLEKSTPKDNGPEGPAIGKAVPMMGKFIGNALLEVAKARGEPIPPDPPNEIAKFLCEEDPSVTVTDLFKEIIIGQTMFSPEASQYSGFSNNLTRVWTRKKESKLLPWSEALADYQNLSESAVANWPEQDIFYPLLISVYMENTNPEARNYFKVDAQDALRKWRTPGTTLLRIYPTKKDWKEGIVYSILEHRGEEPFMIWAPLSFNVLKGIDDAGQRTTRYFIIDHLVGEFREKLQALRAHMDLPPFFPLPQYGVSERLRKQGLTEEEARQAAAIFRVEAEACLLEIWKKLCPTMSDKAFRSNTNALSKLSMPFWAEDSVPTESRQSVPDYSYIRDIPPHQTSRRKYTLSYVPDTEMDHEWDFDDRHHSRTHLTDNFPQDDQHDSRNLQAAVAARLVGTRPAAYERGSQLGQGRLRDSIMGPHYAWDSPIKLSQTRTLIVTAVKNETSNNWHNNDPIYINELPGSQDSQLGDQDQHRRPRLPGRDPNDPDDPDDDGPPGGGPPRGPSGNPDPRRPRTPGRPYIAPGGPNGRQPSGRGLNGRGLPGGGPPGGGPPGNVQPPYRLPVNQYSVNDGFKFKKKSS